MIDAPRTPPHPRPRHRLLRFLLPVLLLHALLLASLPYWPQHEPAGRQGVNVELTPATTVVSAPPATHTTPAPTTARPPAQVRPQSGPAEPPSAPAAVIARQVEPASAVVHQEISQAKPPRTAAAAPPAPPTPAVAKPDQAAAASRPSATAEAGTPSQTWRADYRSALRNALARYHQYPTQARRFGLSGVVEVGFVIRRDGVFENIHVVHSSHAQLLDQAALDTVRRLGRFRPLPEDYSEDSWALSVPLVYRLD
jgi:protein TonB